MPKVSVSVTQIIIGAHFLPIVALIFLLFASMTNTAFSKRQTSLFMVAIGISIFMLADICLDYLMTLTRGGPYYIVRRITTFFNFAFAPIVPYILLVLIDEGRSKRRYLLYAVPLLANVILCFLSMFYPIVFSISARNVYDRGPLFLLPVLMAMLYLFFMLLSRVKSHVQMRRNERLFVICAIGLQVLSIVFETFMQLVMISWACTSFSLMMFYFILNSQRLVMDQLTGVYNRHMYAKAKERLLLRNQGGIIGVIDLNDFKYVNDTYGHERGDKCLIALAEALNKHLSSTSSVYRFGGDEFVFLSRSNNTERVERALARVAEELKPFEITFAYGLAQYLGKNMQEAFELADSNMYEHKHMMKGLAPEQVEAERVAVSRPAFSKIDNDRVQ